jgi:hypothetical protein
LKHLPSTYATAQAKEAQGVAAYGQKVQAQSFACQADAETAIAREQGHGDGQRGRPPQSWRFHTLSYRVEAFQQRLKRRRRGRPAKDEPVEEETRYRLVVEAQAITRCEAAHGWMVLATTLAASTHPDAVILQAYQDQASTVEHGLRWIKNAAAITPMWLEKPERLAALAMVTVLSLLVYGLLQRQVRLYLQAHHQQVPGHKKPTAQPTAAVVMSLFRVVMQVYLEADEAIARHVYGWQAHHALICDAVGVDSSWYGITPT